MTKKNVTSPLSSLSPALRWALLAVLGAGLVVGVIQCIPGFRAYGFFPALIGSLALLVAAAVVGALVALLLAALKRLRWQTAFAFVSVVVFCATTVYLELYLLPLFAFGMAVVYLAVMSFTGKYCGLARPKRLWRYGLMGLSAAICGALLVLTLWPGPALPDRPERAALALPGAVAMDAGALEDPSASGDYAYQTLYYAVPGQKVDPYPGQPLLSSRAVDASAMLEGWNGMRTSWLGFGPEALPLNGQIWMPEGEGPFPLALIVHGNHDAGDRSDGGYAYLGELLASRGIIAVSVDENFLNSAILYDAIIFAGLQEENDARAYVLLEHLRQWYDWNADTSSPFFGKVDFDNIALIGHSRGGEAVATAASFADLSVYPDNGLVRFDYPFRVNSVVAIAPMHEQYSPAGLEVALEGVNYLTLHGEHDMDVVSFKGDDMYRRTDVSGGGIKAYAWIQYANHGQFNSTWGRDDATGLTNLVFNRDVLMPMEEQQQAAKVFVGAFLESTLHGREEYNALFRDFAGGAAWLPSALYVTDYADGQTTLLDGFDDDYDIARSASGQVVYAAQDLEEWTQDILPGKWENSNRVLTLRWEEGQSPVFSMAFAEGTVAVGDTLAVSLCSGEPGVTFAIRLTDRAGNTVVRSVDDLGGVVGQIDAPIAKPIASSILVGDSEPVLQMVRIPTDRFAGLSGDIAAMEWVMAGGGTTETEQVLYVDDLRVEEK